MGPGVYGALWDEDRAHTSDFVIIWGLRPGAAALHHLLPPVLHDAIEVREVLRCKYIQIGYCMTQERKLCVELVMLMKK